MPERQDQPGRPATGDDLTGTTVGRFAIRSRLGAGGMGEVYLANDQKLKRLVALKRLAPHLRADQHYRERFFREAERASSLSHPHIAGIYDVFEEKGEPFLVMEYVEGTTLRERLREPLPFELFLKIALQCAEALVAAHAKRLVHRDIKPENIMLTSTGEVKILDFGVARRLRHTDAQAVTDSDASQLEGGLAGTIAYMAPEVLTDKESDGRADIFSLGIVFYEVLAGKHPFTGPNLVTTTDRILHEIAPPPSKVNPRAPAELDPVVGKMLAKNPSERYSGAGELLAEFQSLGSQPTPVVLSRPKLGRGRRWGTALAAMILLSLAAVLVPAVRQRVLHRFENAPALEQKSLVVLPFRSIGGGPEDQFYCDGMTETLTAKLTQLTATHELAVAPASEVRARQVASAEAARRDLGGTLVLAGTVFRSGGKVRINYELVDTKTLRQLRADTITAEASDPFAVQDRVAEGVTQMLDLALGPAERRAIATHGTEVAGAFDLYLEGRGYLQNYQKSENVGSALKVFNKALELDPNYALAHAGLGEAYWKQYENSNETRWVESARQACERALNLNAQLAAGHLCLGTVDNGTGKYEDAQAEFRRALESEPTSDDAYRGLAFAYERLGKTADAERTYRQAIKLRPLYWAGYSWLGVFYYRTGRFAEAAHMFERVVELSPENHRGYYNLGATYSMLGRWSEAEQTYKKSIALLESGAAYSNLGTLYFFEGRYTDAARAFEKAVGLQPKDEYIRGNLADGYRWAPGEAHKAAQAYAQAILLTEDDLRVNPRSAETLAHLALYRAKTGQRVEAVKAIEQAIALSPDSVDRMYNAALVYHLVGDRQRALSWLRKAVEKGYSVREIRADPELRDLHKEPIFQELVGIQ